MLKLIRWLDLVSRTASRAGAAVGISFIIIVTFMITFNSLSRYFFNKPFLFVDEYAQYMLVGIFYFGVGYTLRAQKHVSADLFVRGLDARKRTLLDFVTGLLGLIVIFVLWRYGWDNFLSNFRGNIRSLTPLETPLWVPAGFVAIGLTLFLLDMLCHVLTLGVRLIHPDRARDWVESEDPSLTG